MTLHSKIFTQLSQWKLIHSTYMTMVPYIKQYKHAEYMSSLGAVTREHYWSIISYAF